MTLKLIHETCKAKRKKNKHIMWNKNSLDKLNSKKEKTEGLEDTAIKNYPNWSIWRKKDERKLFTHEKSDQFFFNWWRL